jgi:glycerate-2-kinase
LIVRDALAAAFTRAIGSFDLGRRVADALAAIEPIAGTRIVAIGKAAPAMAAAAMRVYDAHIDRALVIAPDGTPSTLPALDDPRLTLLRGSHPIPDARSVVAGERALAFVRGAPLTIALVSGGASALACAPHPDLTLDAKRDLTRALLASGASITAINVVRRHVSRLKGGGLTRALKPEHRPPSPAFEILRASGTERVYPRG